MVDRASVRGEILKWLASDDGNRTSGKIVHHMSGWTPAIKSIAADPVADPGQPLLAPLDTSV
jgi:hypothetical protein